MSDQPAAPPGVTLHPQALCESHDVGAGTRIWAFAHVLPRARIGRDCNICDHVFIENDVVLGDRVTVKSGVQLWDGLRVADDVFIGPNATFSNDKYPRSKQHQAEVLQTWIDRGASVGGGAVVLPGLRVGARAMIGAGSVVTHDVPPKAIVVGNPAQIVGYVDATASRAPLPDSRRPGSGDVIGNVGHGRDAAPDAVRHRSARRAVGGRVPGPAALRAEALLPRLRRARHGRARRARAPRVSSVSGLCQGGCQRRRRRRRAHAGDRLDRPNLGIYVPPMVWAVQYKYTPDALLWCWHRLRTILPTTSATTTSFSPSSGADR